MSRKHWSSDKIFTRLLENKSDTTYRKNIQELHSRATEDVFAKCCELVKSSNQKDKIIGVDVLSQLEIDQPFRKEETLQILFKLLETEVSPKVLVSIFNAIGHRNYETLSDSNIQVLSGYRNHANNDVRYNLVYALLCVDNPTAIETLIYLMNDKMSWIRDWATFGLGTQIDRDSEIIREALWKRVSDKHQEARFEAIVGLAKRKDIRVKEIINRELLNEEYGVLLFEAIEELNDKEFLPILYQTLEKDEKDKNVKSYWIDAVKSCIERLNKP
jgi:HEAT repeat protein